MLRKTQHNKVKDAQAMRKQAWFAALWGNPPLDKVRDILTGRPTTTQAREIDNVRKSKVNNE